MPFNFKQYTANNPLLNEYISDEEYDTMDDDQLDAAEEAGELNPSDEPIGPNEAENAGTPRVDFEDAARKALEAGVDKHTLHKIIDWI